MRSRWCLRSKQWPRSPCGRSSPCPTFQPRRRRPRRPRHGRLPSPHSASSCAPPLPAGEDGPPRGTLRHRLGILGGVGWGPIAAAAAAIAVRHRSGRRRWEFGVDAVYHPPRTLRYAGGVAGGRFQSVSVAAVGCGVLGTDRIAVPVCAGAEAGALAGVGVGAFRTRRGTEPWVSLRLDAGVRAALSERLEVGLEAQGAAALLRPAFNVGERAPLTRTPGVLVRGLVAFFWRLP